MPDQGVTLNARIQYKKDTDANWTSNNPVLLENELIIVEMENGECRFKIGDGTSSYTELPFIASGFSGVLGIEHGGTGAANAADARSNIGAQANLGFTPVQQGGGENQISAHKVYLGWTGYSLDVQVDDYNLGSVMTSSESIHEVLPVSKGGTGALDADTARINLGAQASLGFTPIQQGGGTNQMNNKVYIGWTGNSLDVQVDNVNLGSILTSGKAISEVLPVSRGGTGALNAADARTNLGFYKVRLYQGNLSAGSATLEYGANYRALIIVGRPSSAADRVTQIISAEAWTDAPLQFCDNEHWIRYNVTSSGSHLVINILTNDEGGRIEYVFGIM